VEWLKVKDLSLSPYTKKKKKDIPYLKSQLLRRQR
jgi:hypothetical protein